MGTRDKASSFWQEWKSSDQARDVSGVDLKESGEAPDYQGDDENFKTLRI
jgi:hypothetical protein